MDFFVFWHAHRTLPLPVAAQRLPLAVEFIELGCALTCECYQIGGGDSLVDDVVGQIVPVVAAVQDHAVG